LITGANKGIGFATAQLLAKKDIKVIIAARNPKLGLDAAAKINATQPLHPAVFLEMDVADNKSVEAALATFKTQFDKLDILINNAGILQDTESATQVTQKSLHETFQVNFFGTVHVTQVFLPLLKLSSAPRIVFVSSNLASLTKHSDPTWGDYHAKFASYNASKTALNAYCIHLAAELRESAFKINAVHPGYVQTDMTSGKGPVTPDQAAQVLAKYALLPNDGPTGGFFDHKGRHDW